jgi:hypothetical protein
MPPLPAPWHRLPLAAARSLLCAHLLLLEEKEEESEEGEDNDADEDEEDDDNKMRMNDADEDDDTSQIFVQRARASRIPSLLLAIERLLSSASPRVCVAEQRSAETAMPSSG